MTLSAAAPALDLRRDARGRLVLRDAAGAVHEHVIPVRAFPLGAPEEWIALVDELGRERALIADLRELPAATQALVRDELGAREFVPRIVRILDISAGAEPTHWHVVTDRGESRFTLVVEENVRPLPGGAVLIADAHGIRYRVDDPAALDGKSRKLLRRYV